MIVSNDPDTYSWKILPRRRVSHAMSACGDKLKGICGQTLSYNHSELNDESSKTTRCEQCLVTIVSGESSRYYHCYVGYVPINIKRKRRLAWKEYRKTHDRQR